MYVCVHVCGLLHKATQRKEQRPQTNKNRPKDEERGARPTDRLTDLGTRPLRNTKTDTNREKQKTNRRMKTNKIELSIAWKQGIHSDCRTT